jgi:hypothetical protein
LNQNREILARIHGKRKRKEDLESDEKKALTSISSELWKTSDFSIVNNQNKKPMVLLLDPDKQATKVCNTLFTHLSASLKATTRETYHQSVVMQIARGDPNHVRGSESGTEGEDKEDEEEEEEEGIYSARPTKKLFEFLNLLEGSRNGGGTNITEEPENNNKIAFRRRLSRLAFKRFHAITGFGIWISSCRTKEKNLDCYMLKIRVNSNNVPPKVIEKVLEAIKECRKVDGSALIYQQGSGIVPPDEEIGIQIVAN